MKPLWKVKGSLNQTSWKVCDVRIVRYTWVLSLLFSVTLSLCLTVCVCLCLCVLCVIVVLVVVVVVVEGGEEEGGREEKGRD